MKKAFLCTWTDDFDHNRLEVVSTPVEELQRRQGRASAIFTATDGPEIPDRSVLRSVVFLVPRSTSRLLAILTNDLGEDIRDAAFISYGHASVVLLLRDEAAWTSIKTMLADTVAGYEVWYCNDQGVITRAELSRPAPAHDLPQPPLVSEVGLSFEAAAQVRQFNANMAILSRLARSYAQEAWPLVQSLQGRVAEIVEALQPGADPTPDDIRRRVVHESILVEVNAVVTLYSSQLGSGTLPVGHSRFAVGEYSLLGIGAPVRFAWAFYYHLNAVFAGRDHVRRLAETLRLLPAFDWRAPNSNTRDYSTWETARDRIRATPTSANTAPRFHIPHFSSRWGFHESLHGISLSWQCIYSSACKEWNYLTLTHEFLHSQVRAMSAHLFDPSAEPDVFERACRDYNNQEQGDSALSSLRSAYIEALLISYSVSKAGREIAANVNSDQAPSIKIAIPEEIDVDTLILAHREHSDLLTEVTVHVLDFRYMYSSRVDEYIDSIWSTWSLVPTVSDQVPYYVLRTLCAIADDRFTDDHFELFEQVREKLLAALRAMASNREVRPAISAAINLLEDDKACQAMSFQFAVLQYCVQIALHFFYDRAIVVDLLKDQNATTDGTRSTYGLTVGEYAGLEISSPLLFLLDQFDSYPEQAGRNPTEFIGLWQMLQVL